MMKTPLFSTSRLDFYEVNPRICQHLFEEETDEVIMHFFGLTSPEQLAAEKDKYKRGLAMFNKSFQYFMLRFKPTDETIGWCGYHTWYTGHNRAEIGYHIFPEELRNKGLMTEAIRPVIDYGFETMKLHRIEAMVAPENVPSLKTLDKLGFVKEGVLREHYFANNRMEDSVIFGLLRSEYQKRKSH